LILATIELGVIPSLYYLNSWKIEKRQYL